MFLKLKNTERTFNVNAPTERCVKGAEKNYWVISFGVNEQLTAEDIEEYFAVENIEKMTFVTPLPNGTEYEFVASGYGKKISSIIRHAEDGSCIVELQFSKEA